MEDFPGPLGKTCLVWNGEGGERGGTCPELGTDNRKSQRQPIPTINYQHPTNDRRQPGTNNNHRQRQPTTNSLHSTTDSRQQATNNTQRQLHRQSTHTTRQPTADNQHQTTISDSYTDKRQPKTSNKQEPQIVTPHMHTHTRQQPITDQLPKDTKL